MEQETSQSRPKCGNEHLSCTVQHARTIRFTYWMYGLSSVCVSSYCRMRAITLSYAGPNTVYCLCTTELLPAYDIQHNKRAWSWNHARLFSSLIGSNHDDGHPVCLNVWYYLMCCSDENWYSSEYLVKFRTFDYQGIVVFLAYVLCTVVSIKSSRERIN